MNPPCPTCKTEMEVIDEPPKLVCPDYTCPDEYGEKVE